MRTTVQKGASGTRLPLTDIQTLRKRARQHIEEGAVTSGYAADREAVIKMLNEALATELVCVLRYKRHCFMATGIHVTPVATEFLQHANEEMLHAERIATESYREMAGYLAGQDPTTRRMIEQILASEEEHADDLSSLLEGLAD